jgi:hypothetical protein
VTARGGERRIAVPCGDVEYFLPAAQVDSFAKILADDLQRHADQGKVAGSPRILLPGLDQLEIGSRGLKLCRNTHRHSPQLS